MLSTTKLSPRNLARLRRDLQTAGVKQKDIAERADVTKFMVSHVFAGRYVSAPVIRAAKELLAEAKMNGSTALADVAAGRV